MFGQDDPRNDYQPFGYVGRVPLYFTTLLVIGYAAAFVVLVMMHSSPSVDLPDWLIYDSGDIQGHFQFWRFLTYPLMNMPPSIWFVVELWLLYSFGREVEKFLGRTTFAVIYLALVTLGPCVLTAAALWVHEPLRLGGSFPVNYAVFVAFATIYPTAEIICGGIQAMWVAIVLLAAYALQYLYYGMVVQLGIFLLTCLAAFLFIKYLRGQIGFSFSVRNYFRLRRSRKNLRVLPRARRVLPEERTPMLQDEVIESIDPLLDKISKHGIGSLTEKERQKLEDARAELMRKNVE